VPFAKKTEDDPNTGIPTFGHQNNWHVIPHEDAESPTHPGTTIKRDTTSRRRLRVGVNKGFIHLTF